MPARTLKQNNRRVRTKVSAGTPKKFTPAIITTIEATAADTIRLTFSTRVITALLPNYKAGADGDQTVTTMTPISDTVVELVFSGDVAGTNLLVTEGDQGIRTWPAGFVPAGVYAIPTFP